MILYSGTLGSGTAPQDRRPRVRFPMVSLKLLIDIILPAALYFLANKGGRCIGLKTLPPSCAECLKIWELQPPGTLWACNRPVQGLLYLLPMLLRTTTSISGIDKEGKVQHTYTIQLWAQLHKFVLIMQILGTGGYFRSCKDCIFVRMKKKYVYHLSIQDTCHSSLVFVRMLNIGP